MPTPLPTGLPVDDQSETGAGLRGSAWVFVVSDPSLLPPLNWLQGDLSDVGVRTYSEPQNWDEV